MFVTVLYFGGRSVIEGTLTAGTFVVVSCTCVNSTAR